MSEISDGYKLNYDGDKQVQIIIASIEDDNVGSGYEYWKCSTNQNTKRYRHNKDDKIRLREWAEEKVELGKLQVRNIKNARDYALLALWIITVHLKKADAVRKNDAYYYFEEKFKTISASAQSFSRAFNSPSNSKFFRNNGELYFLTTEGQKIVEDWIGGKPFENSITIEADENI